MTIDAPRQNDDSNACGKNPDSTEPGDPESHPFAIEQIYKTKEVDQAIQMYQGELVLDSNGHKVVGEGEIRWDWLPIPAIRFLLRVEIPVFDFTPDSQITLEIPKSATSIAATVTSVRTNIGGGDYPGIIRGYVRDTELGNGKDLSYIVFGVPNFVEYTGTPICDREEPRYRAGRAVMVADNWRVTLDEIPAQVDDLKDKNGYILTHVGRLEKADKSTFAKAEAEDMLQCLFRFLSFCRGGWVAPILSVGFGPDGSRLWEQWRGWKVDRWRRGMPWLNSFSAHGLTGAFPGFLRRWKDEKWKASLELAIHWYVEARKSAGGVEGSVILMQAAYELLAWSYFVGDRKSLSQSGFRELPAMDKIRLLLSVCCIPLAIPASLTELNAVASAFNSQDGPEVLTLIRNNLVHPDPEKRRKVLGSTASKQYEAWKLGLWYLELIILWICGYQGDYSCRVSSARFKGDEVQKVPWALP